MKIQTHIKAGVILTARNHNQALVATAPAPAAASAQPTPAPASAPSNGLKVSTYVKAGGTSWNHSQTQVVAR